MKRVIAILTLAAAGLLAACGPGTGGSVESLTPIESAPAVSAEPSMVAPSESSSTAPLASASPSTVP